MAGSEGERNSAVDPAKRLPLDTCYSLATTRTFQTNTTLSCDTPKRSIVHDGILRTKNDDVGRKFCIQIEHIHLFQVSETLGDVNY